LSDYKVSYLTSDETFTVNLDETILDAAIRQNVTIPYSCRSGTCRTCLAEIVAGEILQEETEDCAITKEEIEANRRLLCLSFCKSDAVIRRIVRRRNESSGT